LQAAQQQKYHTGPGGLTGEQRTLDMATVTEKVSEVLVGTTQEPQLSQVDRATFLKHAKTDDAGERYLDEEDFVNAIAPESEDYVSTSVIYVFPLVY